MRETIGNPGLVSVLGFLMDPPPPVPEVEGLSSAVTVLVRKSFPASLALPSSGCQCWAWGRDRVADKNYICKQ